MNRVGEIGNWVTFEACINIVFEMCSQFSTIQGLTVHVIVSILMNYCNLKFKRNI